MQRLAAVPNVVALFLAGGKHEILSAVGLDDLGDGLGGQLDHVVVTLELEEERVGLIKLNWASLCVDERVSLGRKCAWHEKDKPLIC